MTAANTPVPANGDTRPHNLPAAMAQHRTDYWTWVENHADKGLRADLIELRDHWRDCNTRFFDGRMLEPYITLTEPSNPRRYAQCCPESSWGSRLEIRLRPSLLAGTHPDMDGPRAGRMLFVKDVLLHEMVHQHVMEHQPDVNEDSYHGHGPVFTAHCNRIGEQLGLPAVIVRNRRGKLARPKSAQWPHCVVPPDRYLGAYQRDRDAAVTTSRDMSLGDVPNVATAVEIDAEDTPLTRVEKRFDVALQEMRWFLERTVQARQAGMNVILSPDEAGQLYAALMEFMGDVAILMEDS
jgi:hypothetical protein